MKYRIREFDSPLAHMAIDIGKSKHLYTAESMIEAEAWEANYRAIYKGVKTEIIRNRGKFIVKRK